MKIFIGNLAYSAEDHDLIEFFAGAGIAVTDAKVIRDRDTGQGRGFGFVTVSDDDAEAALQLDQAEMTVDGKARVLRINEATTPERGRGGRR